MGVETQEKELSADECTRLAEGYKIIGDNLQDIVRICFRGDSSMLPRLQKHIEQHKDEFQKYLEHQDEEFDVMIEKLQAFEQREGHQHVQEAQDRALSWWINYQKYRLDRLQLSEKDENKLLKIKFDFRDDKDWDTNLHGWDTRRTT